jgi:hypothetical protein
MEHLDENIEIEKWLKIDKNLGNYPSMDTEYLWRADYAHPVNVPHKRVNFRLCDFSSK